MIRIEAREPDAPLLVVFSSHRDPGKFGLETGIWWHCQHETRCGMVILGRGEYRRGDLDDPERILDEARKQTGSVGPVVVIGHRKGGIYAVLFAAALADLQMAPKSLLAYAPVWDGNSLLGRWIAYWWRRHRQVAKVDLALFAVNECDPLAKGQAEQACNAHLAADVPSDVVKIECAGDESRWRGERHEWKKRETPALLSQALGMEAAIQTLEELQ